MNSLFDIMNSKEKGKGVFAKTSFNVFAPVMKFTNPILRNNLSARVTAIQIGPDLYLDSEPGELRDFLNHSCDANCKIDVRNMALVAIRDIRPGEEITFNYCTTELDLLTKNEEFECKCGSDNCIGIVKGFLHLTKEEKNRIRSFLVPYLAGMH